MVAFRYLTANCPILTLVHDCSFQIHLLPFYLKIIQTCSLSHLENECQWRVNDFWYWILVIYKVTAYKTSKNEVVAAFKAKNQRHMLAAPF